MRKKKQNTEIASDIKEAINKDKKDKKKIECLILTEDKLLPEKTKEAKLLDKLDKWNEADMEAYGYMIYTKNGDNKGLEINEEEFPDLGVNDGLQGIDEQQEILDNNILNKGENITTPFLDENFDDGENAEAKNDVNIEIGEGVDLVQEIATEENFKKLLEAEYQETPKKDEETKLGYDAFNSIMDEHIAEMKTRKRNRKDDLEEGEEIDTTCSNTKKKTKKD